jgi:tol-pal system protein YbgF
MNRALIAAPGKILISLSTSILVSGVAAQDVGSVIESQGITPGNAEQLNSRRSSSVGNNDALSLLLEQNQQLRTEVQALRGLVEEQGFEVRKMQRDSLNRYTNVDDRLSAIEANGIASSSANNNTTIVTNDFDSSDNRSSSIPTSTQNIGIRSIDGLVNEPEQTPSVLEVITPPPTPTISSRGTLQPAVLSEQQLYQMAYQSVINSNFERSIAEFDQYMNIYPNGRFVTNAHYWKGQAYLYLTRYTEAKDSYEVILSQYENHAKLPDAMYGLGLAYQGLGNITQARQLLNEIKRRFPNTGAASLADTKLLQLD